MKLAMRTGLMLLLAGALAADEKSVEKERREMSRVLRRGGADYDARVDVLERLRKNDAHDRVKLCALALKNPARPVRVIAAEILGTIRDLRVVPILIKALEKEKKVTVQNVIVQSLHELTHRPLGNNARRWKDWWKTNKNDFGLPPPHEAPKARPKKKKKNTGERRSVSVPRFYGIAVDATDIVFVIDRSGSMRRNQPKSTSSRWDVAMNEVRAVIDKLPSHARVNVVLFGTDVWTWRDGLTTLDAQTKQRLDADLRGQGPGGGTYLWEGMEQALEEREVEAIYLLSDGEASGGKFSRDSDILREVAKRNRYRRAIIHVVAVGYDSSLLQKLASKNGGRYVKR